MDSKSNLSGPHRLRAELVDVTTIRNDISSAASSASSENSAPPASVEEFTRPQCPSGITGLEAIVVLDLQGDDLSFGSLDKTYLANQSE